MNSFNVQQKIFEKDSLEYMIMESTGYLPLSTDRSK